MPRPVPGPRARALVAATLTAAILGPVSELHAQASAGSDSVRVTLPAVTVTALREREDVRKIPAAAFVLGHDKLAATATPRLTTLLTTLPGLYAYQETATGEPSVVDPRGFTANGLSSYLKVLLDGQETRDLENGNVDWDWLVPEDAERVEIVQGPGAWAYGDGAEGGILNIVRARPALGTSARGSVRGGSFGQVGGNLGFGWASERWNLGLDGGRRVADGWRERSREEVSSAGVNVHFRDGVLPRGSLSVSFLDADREDPGYLTPDQLADDPEQAENPQDAIKSQRVLLNAALTAGNGRIGEWRLSPYARLEDGEQVKTLFFETDFHPTEAQVFGAELGWRKDAGLAGRPLSLQAGVTGEASRLESDYHLGTDDTGPHITDTEAERSSISAYAGARLELDGATTLRAGLRGDRIFTNAEEHGGVIAPDPTSLGDRTMEALSPYAALQRTLGPRASVYASFSQAFHAPTLDQMYGQRPFTFPFPPPTYITISNGDLQPQRANSAELGTRWDGANGASAMLTAYSMWVRDEIDFDLTNFRYQNISKSLHQGLIGSLGCPVAARLSVMVSGTWQPTTIREGTLDGNQINAVPEGMAYGKLTWAPIANASLDAGVRWVGRQWLDKENDHPIGDFTTVELGGSMRWQHLRASVRVANLLDRRFVETGFIGVSGEERLWPGAGPRATVALKFE